MHSIGVRGKAAMKWSGGRGGGGFEVRARMMTYLAKSREANHIHKHTHRTHFGSPSSVELFGLQSLRTSSFFLCEE